MNRCYSYLGFSFGTLNALSTVGQQMSYTSTVPERNTLELQLTDKSLYALHIDRMLEIHRSHEKNI